MGIKEYNIDREMKSEKNAIREVEPYFFDLKHDFGIRDDLFYNMLIAVTEAVNNAVYHGNKCCGDKCIRFKMDVEGRRVYVSVTDQGVGFDPLELDDPREPENILKASGRGVFLIKELADVAEFTMDETGTTVSMEFQI